MSEGAVKRATWADDTDSDVEEATSKVAGNKKGMASWADSDTESDVEDAPPPPKKLDAFGESESESEESEDESEDESEEEKEVVERPSSKTGGVVESVAVEEEGPEAITGEDASQILNLSKKERKALKQKQLDDLDTLLGEFGVTTPDEPVAVANGSTPAEGTPEDKALPEREGGDGAGGKKKKKKKKEKKADDGDNASKGPGDDAAPKAEEPDVVVVKPIAAALKMKGKKKASGSGAKPSAAAMKAAKEAADKEAKKKKKRDKKNFNQAPPGK